jgi:hypothetical protein
MHIEPKMRLAAALAADLHRGAHVNDENRVRPGISFNYSRRISLHANDELAQIHVEILTNHPPNFQADNDSKNRIPLRKKFDDRARISGNLLTKVCRLLYTLIYGRSR